MYPINKYLFETIFEKNNEMYIEFMCGIDTEYTDLINILKFEINFRKYVKLFISC